MRHIYDIIYRPIYSRSRFLNLNPLMKVHKNHQVKTIQFFSKLYLGQIASACARIMLRCPPWRNNDGFSIST